MGDVKDRTAELSLPLRVGAEESVIFDNDDDTIAEVFYGPGELTPAELSASAKTRAAYIVKAANGYAKAIEALDGLAKAYRTAITLLGANAFGIVDDPVLRDALAVLSDLGEG